MAWHEESDNGKSVCKMSFVKCTNVPPNRVNGIGKETVVRFKMPLVVL